MFFCKVPSLLVICWLITFGFHSFLLSKQTSDFLGAVSISLKGGSQEAPSHTIISPSLKGRVVFRGQIETSSDNNLTFYRVPDLLDPTVLANPFKVGIFTTTKARAVAVLNDANKTIDRIDIVDQGAGYLAKPEVFIRFPAYTSGYLGDLESGVAYVDSNLTGGTIASVQLSDVGSGYFYPPEVEIEGGAHFVRLVDEDSNYSGKFHRITSNSGNSLTLENDLYEDLQIVFEDDSEVEIFESWTLGELFGYETSPFNVTENNGSVTYDFIHLLKPSSNQSGTNDDYTAYFHKDGAWRKVDDENYIANHEVISPDASLIVSRRSALDLDLNLSGIALIDSTYLELPVGGKKNLINNPYNVDLMISDLISPEFISEDNQSSFKWFANSQQDKADNIMVLNDGIWSTYWHDGTNRNITEKAFATASPGSGVGASMMQRDISLSSGQILGMTNPGSNEDFVEVNSPNHGLKDGMIVRILDVVGYKTNESKDLVNSDDEVVDNNESALIINSSANGFHYVTETTLNSFKLKDKFGDCVFIYDGTAKWVTGSSGNGYEQNCYVSFVGGGGLGAQGIAVVENGVVESIQITEPGAGYVEAPKVIIHSGGWRKLGAGNSPFSDLSVPAGAGILLSRNNPLADAVQIPIPNPFK